MPRSETNNKFYLVLCICLEFEQTNKSMYFYVALCVSTKHVARIAHQIESVSRIRDTYT